MPRSRQRLLVGRTAPEPPPQSTEEARYDAAWTAYVEVARERVAVGLPELTRLVATRLGLDPTDPASEELVDLVSDDVLDDPAGPLVILVPDVVVHAPALTDGIVLTHRLSADELAAEHLDLGTDLAGFLRCPDARVAGGPLHVDEAGDDTGADEPAQWGGPPGWLAEFAAGALLAVRATADGAVSLSVLDHEPAAEPELVAALRAIYEAELAEPGLPVPAELLVLGLLHADRAAFAEPRPPLTELAAAAGLLRRGEEFAHDESVWAEAEAADREFRLVAGLETEEQREAALRAFALLADPDDPAALRSALALLADADVLDAVVGELLHEPDDDGERVRAAVALAERLVAVAGRSPREAAARYVAAVVAERDGRVLDAESHLRAAALADEGWELVEDRLAWYESDRGDAAAAAARWHAIDVPADHPDLAAVAPFATAGPEPGRNDPCWCGSGRKYKQCHRGRPVQAPLADRVHWLHHKARSYVERRGGPASRALLRWADDLDVDEPDGPEVVDAVLAHDGGFAWFLADRGPLLPADEAELAASWAGARPSVYEVEGIRSGQGLTLRDLRDGSRADVPLPAGPAPRMGELVLAVLLPDGSGTGHLLVGALPVQRGTERDLLAQFDAT
ncbi:SEC-C metal-binding domain-containing protein [Pseudonocardia kunmingensis]|uniref:SEC-C motif-containing protein n=1 Tax=Pseudonocardia kunmingensis TaxID=630975 RepID=A0A543CY80_9PSEU|nr:SEC-C metal-binding domain-containing protein [Pseudonocardia kunmingensis]TQM02064.1 SEC-C motif-containing protein [Pseudonocardia kunmingensis]